MTENGFLCSYSLAFLCSQFPFLPISVPNFFVINFHSHWIPVGFSFLFGIPFPYLSLNIFVVYFLISERFSYFISQ